MPCANSDPGMITCIHPNRNDYQMIKAVNLTKSFGSRKVLRGLSLEIIPSEIVSLVGVNGAGKTTLLRILADLSRPEAGVIHYGNFTSRSQPAIYRRQLGVVLHAPMLYGNLTGRENLLFFSRLYQVPDLEDRIAAVLAMVNLRQRANDLVRIYSRGMQQRLAIARALLHDPAVLLLDEPYTGLDQDSAAVFESLIQQAAANGKMVLLATHDLDKACRSSTRIDLLHQGRIVWSLPGEALTPESLVSAYRDTTGRTPNTRESGSTG